MGVAEHEVAARQTHRHARRPVVPQEVHHAGHAQLASDDRDRVIVFAQRELAPEVEVVRITALVEGERHAAVEKDDRTLDRRHLDGDEIPVENEDWKGQYVGHRAGAPISWVL